MSNEEGKIVLETTNDVILGAVEAFDGQVVSDDTVPFSINGDVINLDDLDDIEESSGSVVIPPANNVRLRIDEAKSTVMANGALKKIDIRWQIVDGIEIDGKVKFKGSKFYQNGSFFDNVLYYADTSVYTSDYWKSRKYLSTLKTLLKATGVASLDPDNVSSALNGKEVLASIAQVPKEEKNENGEWVESTTEFNNCAKFIKPLM